MPVYTRDVLLTLVGSVISVEVNFALKKSSLFDLYEKVAANERISDADALRLIETKDLNALGANSFARP